MELWKHQQNFLDKNPDKAVICHEAGLGKTRTAIEWLKKRPTLSCLIIVPKAIKQKWKDDLKKWECVNPCTVITKEEVKKGTYTPDAMIIDEAHHVSSPLFIAKMRSQITESVYAIIKRNPAMPRLFLTANPVRSSPANLHTLLYMSVREIDWKEYRKYFYRLQHLPYLPRPAWMPKKGWQKDMPKLINKYCHVALMSDCFDVPVHQYQTIGIDLSEDTKEAIKRTDDNEWEAIKIWYAKNRLENGVEKLEWIKDYIEGRRKVVIVCKYKEQIAMYANEIGKVRYTLTLTGDTKDQGGVIRDAQESAECVLIIQSQVCSGFDLDSFACMIFASFDWSWVNFSQMHGRINRGHNLHRNEYYYLIGGAKDKAVFDAMKLKEDFDIRKIKNG